MNHEVDRVQNYFFIETEVAHRRWVLERELAAAEQCAQARPQNGLKRWSQLAPRAVSYLRSLATPRVPVTSWNVAGEQRAKSLQVNGGGARAT